MKIPSGTVTFLFTDIEGSTMLAQKFPEKYPAALLKHNSILRDGVESHNGFTFKTIGDAFCCAFEDAADAVKAAVSIQKNIASEEWGDAAIKIRIGMHSGDAQWVDKDYNGYVTLARTQRILSSAFGEQIVISNDTFELARNKITEEILFRNLGERRLKDLVQPVRLFQIQTSGLREDFPPLNTLDARPNNLPVQLTSFIGREEEMKQIKNALKESRLLTLIGPGGTGKTRSALQIAADVIDDYTNGVWFIELASKSEKDFLANAVAQVLGIPESNSISAEDSLIEFLKEKNLLIILDNCEHIVDACAALAEKLLKSCNQIKILATSRESLRISGERTHKTSSLLFPDPKNNETPAELTQYESVRLFVERALSVNPDFRVTDKNAKALAGICYQLDGIPLAIELAAARVKILSLEKIQQRLNDNFKLLAGNNRSLMPRQQTLRALIDWSYDLLNEYEKILWSRLSVFSSGWTLEAAEKICADDADEELLIIEHLQNLAEKSIVIYDEENERYKMLETIRQYGSEKLKEGTEYKEIVMKHLHFFTSAAGEISSKITGTDLLQGMKLADSEYGNIEKSLRNSLEFGCIEEGLRIAGSMGSYWFKRGYIREGLRWIERVLEKSTDIKNFSKAKTLIQAGTLSRHSGEYEQSLKYYYESLKIYDEAKNIAGKGNVYSHIGCIFVEQGKFDEALDMFDQAMQICKKEDNQTGTINLLNNIGNALKKGKGDFKKIKQIHEDGLALSRKTGNKNLIFGALNGLGNILLLDTENFNEASKYFEECLSISKETGDKPEMAQTLNNLGALAILNEDYKKAESLFNECLAISRDAGMKFGIPLSIMNLGLAASRQDEFDKAVSLLTESYEQFKSIGNLRGITDSLAHLGDVYYNIDDIEKSKEYFDECLKLSKESSDTRNYLKAIYGLGVVALVKEEFDKASDYFRESFLTSKDIEDHKRVAANLHSLSDVYLKQNKIDKALSVYGFLETYCRQKKISMEIILPKRYSKLNTSILEKLKEEHNADIFEKGKTLTIDEVVNIVTSDAGDS